MQVLVYLAEHPGVVSKEQLITSVWPDVFVSEDVLPGCISALRKAFNDNARRPTVIETIHKSGYRLLLPVQRTNTVGQIENETTKHSAKGKFGQRLAVLAVVSGTIALLLAVFFWSSLRRR
jgi:DNA-binding winged helix-turn-helix (wHTH) protein